jgi:uncharacterized lipoprotein NlpE involved in copper resistance
VSLGAARALGVSLNGSTGRVAFPNSSQFSLTGAISMEAGLKATSTAVTRVWDLHGSGGFTVWKPQIVSCQELRDLAAPAAMFRAAGHPDCWGRSPMRLTYGRINTIEILSQHFHGIVVSVIRASPASCIRVCFACCRRRAFPKGGILTQFKKGSHMKFFSKSVRPRRSSVTLTPPRTRQQPVFELAELEPRVLLSSTILNPSAASYTQDGTYATTNFGTASDLQVKYSTTSGQGYNRITYLEFNLSTVSSVGEATLRLYGNVNNTDILSIGAYPIASPTWTQSGITWDNQPSAGTLLDTTTVSGESDAWFTWDLTGFLQAQKAAGNTTVSIELAGTTNTGGFGDFDSVSTGSDEPQLVVQSADTTLAPTNDAYVQDSTDDNTNFGSSTSLLSKKTTGVNNRNIFATFNTASVSGTLGGAFLQFTGGIESGGTDTNVPVNVYGVSTTSWGQSTITWNNQPTAGTTIEASNTVIDTTTRLYTFDLTSYINAQRAAGYTTVSFMIQAGAVTSSSIIDFNSSNASTGKPVLVLSENGPSIATPAAASPSTVTGTSTSLSVLGSDPAGESSLTYTWYTVSQPTGGDVSVSATGTNASKDVTAYFHANGTYVLYVQLEDPSGYEIDSGFVDITVDPTLTSITLSPTSANLNENGTQQFTATALDQFGNALATQPTFTWSNTGAGSVNSTGLYTAPAAAGSATVTATSGSVSGNASVAVTNAAPTVATPASASPTTVTGTTTNLSVLGADDGGESNLTYTWAATTYPSGATPPTYSANGTNAAKNTTATFSAAGAYTFVATITDSGGRGITSTVNVTVSQTLTSISVTPGTATLSSDSTQQFAATALDQFGTALATEPSFTWSNTGSGTVSSSGLYTAPASAGSATVTASSGGISAHASVTVSSPGPGVATPASASPSAVTGTTSNLSVLGSDPAGESSLTYTWAATSVPSGASAPTYSTNGTNASKNTTAALSAAGAYTFQVTITDASGLTATSSVSVTVSQALTSISVTPGTATLGSDGTQQFAATALDQFGAAMATQPTFTWSHSGAGSVTSTGLYTAPAAVGSDSVSASSGGISGSVAVTIVGPSVATAASASTSDGVNVDLSALGSDPNGESTLTYAWAATSTPDGATVSFGDGGDNSAKSTTAVIDTAGTYTFQVTISDGTNSVTSSVSLDVSQMTTTVSIDQPGAAVVTGGTFSFSATAYDQFGNEMATQPTFTWAVSGVGGTIASDGTYTAPSSDTGTDTVTASGGGASAATLVETGPIVGNVYDDSNDDSMQDSGEAGLPGWMVYLDTNGDGSYEPGEPSTTTDVNGNFALASCGGGSCGGGSCGSGSATLMAVAQSGWSLTQGSSGYAVSTTSGSTSGPDPFGASPATPPAGTVWVDDFQTQSGATQTPVQDGSFTIDRSGADDSLTVYYTLTGTAVEGTDYQSLPFDPGGSGLQVATFAAGQTSVTVPVDPTGSSTGATPFQSVQLNLADPPPGAPAYKLADEVSGTSPVTQPTGAELNIGDPATRPTYTIPTATMTSILAGLDDDSWPVRQAAEDQLVQTALANPDPLQLNQQAIDQINALIPNATPEQQWRLKNAVSRIQNFDGLATTAVTIDAPGAGQQPKAQTVDVQIAKPAGGWPESAALRISPVSGDVGLNARGLQLINPINDLDTESISLTGNSVGDSVIEIELVDAGVGSHPTVKTIYLLVKTQ